MENRTIYQTLRDTVLAHGTRPALTRRLSGREETLTFAALWARTLALRTALLARGLTAGDRVMIVSENRPEWAVTDLACQLAGLITVPVYPTLPACQIARLADDSGSVAAVVSDRAQYDKVLSTRDATSDLRLVITMDPVGDGAPTVADHIAEGAHGVHAADHADPIGEATTPDARATIIYTSGTTGDPKGAVLTQRALLHTSWAVRQLVSLDEHDVFLSFLPLCHVIERVAGHYLPVMIGAQVVYSEGVFAIGHELSAVSPTVFLCVPRLFELVQQKVLDMAAKASPLRRHLFEWAMAIGRRAAETRESGETTGVLLALQHALADRLVLRTLRKKMTGGRARFFVSGGAPLNPETARFFQAAGIGLLEGYGMTEMPVTSINRPVRTIVGTVGPPIPGIEVKIAADGEVLSRGPNRMLEYHRRPDATRDALDEDGWLRSGDIGAIGSDGHLRITDRKKDIIVLATGKNVAPQPIEAALKQSPFIGEIVLVGDKQPTLAALVVPRIDELKRWAQSRGLETSDDAALVATREARALLKSEIEYRSRHLADFEKVKRFAVLPAAFSVAGGELTPTLKVKRRFIAEKYADVIAGLRRP